MNKLLLLFCVFGLATLSYAQENELETISFGTDFFRNEILPKPVVREVIGATVIQVQYEGEEWEQNLERKSAFEYACRLLEEQMPTALPIKVKVKFGRLRVEGNAIAQTDPISDICNMRPMKEGIKEVFRPTIKYRLRDNGLEGVNVLMSFFDSPDGIITFSNDDIFSYSLDFVTEDKYDFVTVALRELCKVLGFCFTSRTNNVDRTIDVTRESIALYDEYALASVYDRYLQNGYDPVNAYNYATSGNATIMFNPYGGTETENDLYSPPIFEKYRSLSFFKPDEANNETKLMQLDLPRGTSIRYLGTWFRPFLKAMGWYTDIPIGEGGGGATTAPTSTKDVKKYNEACSFTGTKKNIDSDEQENANIPEMFNEIGFTSDEVYNYIRQFSSHAVDDKGNIMYGGWAISVLRKDGTWEFIPSSENQDGVSFMPSSIDPNKADQYARSSDGYLRCRVNYEGYPTGFISRLFLLDYLPQKPQLAFSKVMPQTRASDDEYYADVKIAFKNVEGTESILVEQLEEGSPVPFTFYVEDIRAGYFIASVDKEYSTTFRLRAMNKNGETISEQLLVSPLVPVTYTLSSRVNKNVISLELRNSRKRNINKLITDYKVLDLNSSMIVQEGKVLDNNIDINSLGKGVYGLQVADEDGKFYNTKFIK